MRIVLLVISFFLFTVARADNGPYYYEYNSNCSKAYNELLSLQSERAIQYLNREKELHPNNLMRVYIEDYDDCLLLLFNGDKAQLALRRDNLDERIKLLEQGGDDSPWYRLCKSGLYMHWACIYVRFGENLKAANLFRKSFILIKENRKRFPDFKYNEVFYGAEEAALGAIPDNFKWVASIFGMRGDVKSGIKKLEKFLATSNADDLLYNEVVVYYAYLKFYLLSDKESVWSFLNTPKINTNGNLLYSFVKANIAHNFRKAEDCIIVINEAKKVSGYDKYPVLDFELAQAQLLKQDYSCIEAFNSFLSRYKGGLFYKDALLQLSYAYYLKGNAEKAKRVMERVVHEGSSIVDADKQALRFAERGVLPNKALLQIRLLIDGGYYQSALLEIKKHSISDFANEVDKVEFVFRTARAYDEIGEDELAIEYYKKAIKLGYGKREHFAARSALQVGFIYEKNKKPANALLMYKQVLSMDDHDFKSSIDQQAKAGINRLSVH
ncbi:MAG: tetratricopeptide repeat protein [Flavipsychrobacter sp.]